jgi:hypothetical protein
MLRRSAEFGYELRTSAPVITEFLGGSPPALRVTGEYICARLRVSAVDEALARRAAALAQSAARGAPRSGPSAVDALVSAEAERAGGVLVIEGDRKDFEALAGASRAFELVELSELSR